MRINVADFTQQRRKIDGLADERQEHDVGLALSNAVETSGFRGNDQNVIATVLQKPYYSFIGVRGFINHDQLTAFDTHLIHSYARPLFLINRPTLLSKICYYNQLAHISKVSFNKIR